MQLPSLLIVSSPSQVMSLLPSSICSLARLKLSKLKVLCPGESSGCFLHSLFAAVMQFRCSLLGVFFEFIRGKGFVFPFCSVSTLQCFKENVLRCYAQGFDLQLCSWCQSLGLFSVSVCHLLVVFLCAHECVLDAHACFTCVHTSANTVVVRSRAVPRPQAHLSVLNQKCHPNML